MAVRSALRWYGPQVEARVVAAAVTGVNVTLAACLALGIAAAPVDTGNLRASGFMRPAIPTPFGVAGSWGFSAAYAAYVELGTVRMEGRNFMRNAATVQYPLLAGRIQAALR